jgi:hypothetical protein
VVLLKAFARVGPLLAREAGLRNQQVLDCREGS